MSLYFEAHVTIEPVEGERHEAFGVICGLHGFRVAELLMKNRKSGTLERSPYDSFCTGRSPKYADLEGRMLRLLKDLREAGYQIWRYKIEDTLLDSRSDDTLFLLDLPKPRPQPIAPFARWPQPTD